MPVLTTNTYNRQAAANYARAWANKFNPAYPQHSSFMPPAGSDCTNFASQCLHQGGWTLVGSPNVFARADNSQWWYGGWAGTGCSRSWGAAENLRQFVTISGRAKKIDRVMDLEPGDLVFYIDAAKIAGHVAVVTRRLSNDLEVCQHSSPQNLDRKMRDVVKEFVKTHLKGNALPNKPLDELIREYTKAGHMHKTIEPFKVSDTFPGLDLPTGRKLPGEM